MAPVRSSGLVYGAALEPSSGTSCHAPLSLSHTVNILLLKNQYYHLCLHSSQIFTHKLCGCTAYDSFNYTTGWKIITNSTFLQNHKVVTRLPTNLSHLRLLLPTGLPSWQWDWTGPITLITLFLVSHFNFLFVPCGGLSWLRVSFLLHLKYTLSYRIVSYRIGYNLFAIFVLLMCDCDFLSKYSKKLTWKWSAVDPAPVAVNCCEIDPKSVYAPQITGSITKVCQLCLNGAVNDAR